MPLNLVSDLMAAFVWSVVVGWMGAAPFGSISPELESSKLESSKSSVWCSDAVGARDVENLPLAAVSLTLVRPGLFLRVFGAPVGCPRG